MEILLIYYAIICNVIICSIQLMIRQSLYLFARINNASLGVKYKGCFVFVSPTVRIESANFTFALLIIISCSILLTAPEFLMNFEWMCEMLQKLHSTFLLQLVLFFGWDLYTLLKKKFLLYNTFFLLTISFAILIKLLVLSPLYWPHIYMHFRGGRYFFLIGC